VRPPKKTGSIWKSSSARRARVVGEVCSRLERTYGLPRLGNPEDPLDDFVFIVLSNKTSPAVAARTYEAVKAAFPSWDALLESDPRKLRALLKPAGLSRVKADQIRKAVRAIRRDFGACDLSSLRNLPADQAEAYMASLPGASTKVAKCVALYTLGAAVLPVDAHVHRVASRLGWTARRRADQCHEELEALVPLQWRYAFHVGCILHGREICRQRRPACSECNLRHHCEYYKMGRRR
jgi:endonuclease-3